MKLVPIVCATAAFALSAGLTTAQQEPDPDLSTGELGGLSPYAPEGQEAEGSEDAVQPETRERTYDKYETATLRALDKITGRSTDFEIKVGAPVVYGSLKIDLSACYQAPPEEPPESAAFLKIETTQAIRMRSMAVPRLASEVDGVSDDGIDAEAIAAGAENDRSGEDSPLSEELLFSGWMFASSPGLSALEHPVYDVWVIRCTERSPVRSSGPGNPAE